MPERPSRRTLVAAAAAAVVLATGGGLLAAGDGEAGAGLQLATPRLYVPGLPVPADLTAAPLAEAEPEPAQADDDASDGAGEARTVSVEGGSSSRGRSADEELDGGNGSADDDLGSDSGATGSGAPSDAEIARELKQLAEFSSTSPTRATLTAKGNAIAPSNAPAAVRAIIAGGNLVARKPYVYGGGHNARFVDTGYDCSGSISYALATAGLVDSPMASGPMMKWGRKGRGKWVTIYANAGHAFMVVAGLRFDTSGRGANKSRWQAAPRSTAGFTAVHPPGL